MPIASPTPIGVTMQTEPVEPGEQRVDRLRAGEEVDFDLGHGRIGGANATRTVGHWVGVSARLGREAGELLADLLARVAPLRLEQHLARNHDQRGRDREADNDRDPPCAART